MKNINQMESVLSNILVAQWLAHDVHYTWQGHSFYGMHILADKVGDMGSLADEIKEAYYMGFRGENPPKDSSIAASAIEQYNKVLSDNGGCCLKAIASQFSYLAASVEVAKREEGLAAGIHSILDAVSQKALVGRALVSHSIEVEEA